MSVTPLQFDLMSHEALDRLRSWEGRAAGARPTAGAAERRTRQGRRRLMAPVFKAVVFDLDGTLVDSVELIALSFQHAIREVHGPGGFAARRPCSTSARPSGSRWCASAPSTPTNWWPSTGSSTTASTTACSSSTTASSTCSNELTKAGCKLGLVTSKSRPTTQMAFDLTGIEPYFDATVCCDEAPGNKPTADPILFCLEHLGVAPADAAYVGDSPADIQAAHAARVIAHRRDLGRLQHRGAGC